MIQKGLLKIYLLYGICGTHMDSNNTNPGKTITMFTKIATELSKPDNKKLLSNFISLTALQVVGFILPLLTIPYLIIVLGVEKFGLVSLAQAVISYFVIFTDYGFNLTATKDISVNRNNHKKISTIFNSVFSTKLILGLISIFLLTIIVFVVPNFKNDRLLFFYSFSMVIGQLLFPVWFFQGVEQMKYITYLNVSAKLIFTGLVFVLIKVPDDYIYVNVLQGTGSIISSIISVWFIRKKFKIHFKFSTINRIKFQLKEGWHILLSSLSVNIYINSNIIILGFFVNPVVLGYYSIAEKIMFAVRQLLVVFSLTIYPHVCKLVKSGHEQLKAFYKKLFVPFALLVFICCTLLFVFSKSVVLIIAGSSNESISILVRILSFAPFIVCLNIPAYQTLLAYNIKKSFSLILTSGSIFCIILNLILANIYGAAGTCITILATESIITLALYLVIELRYKQYSFFN